ncbi:N-acetyltransferase family 8 member 3 [Bemisia tabaci]|uniref:N-acetyltransferase family 8 member 3 n=1 Tax=Bemisia tabaci TaxID=7038 RepID=UPI003B286FF0
MASAMKSYIVIRDYQPGDELQCQEVVKEGTMSTVNAAFFAGLTREITFELMVLMSALMFIFFGFPFSVCFASIPVVIALMYCCIYAGHSFKAMEMLGDLSNIPRVYMSNDHTGFWVAEVLEPCYNFTSPKNIDYSIISQKHFRCLSLDLKQYRKKIIGTVGIVKSRNFENFAWLRRMAVSSGYQRKKVASSLLDEALRFCASKHYVAVELITTECHDSARSLYLKKGFELRQIYHKKYVCNIVSILIFNLYFNLKNFKLVEP